MGPEVVEPRLPSVHQDLGSAHFKPRFQMRAEGVA